MSTYDLEEQEQLSSIKAWWQQYGNLVTYSVVGAALVSLAVQGWHWYQRSQASQAGAIYAVVQKAIAAGDTKAAREKAGELIEKFSGTPQAGLAALLAARVQLDGGDSKSAKAQLAWAAANAKPDELRDLARLRLAGILTDEKAYDEALKQLEKEPASALATEFADLKGDILALQAKPAEAKAAWQGALDKLASVSGEGATSEENQRSTVFRKILTTKIDAMGDKK